MVLEFSCLASRCEGKSTALKVCYSEQLVGILNGPRIVQAVVQTIRQENGAEMQRGDTFVGTLTLL
jgi:hypothetical protein